MQFGQYIRSLRLAKELSVAKAAKELGLTSQKLCDIESGRRNFVHPPFELMKKVAAVYDHPYANLVANAEFFAYEKTIIGELLGNIEPLTEKLESKTIEMVIEAKQYTPEMEALARDANKLATDLKLALLLAKARLDKGPNGKTPAGSRTRSEG